MATATAITVTDLIQRIQRAPGAMATTEQIAYSLGIPETQVAPLTAQARTLGLITTERDPRTLSPMHRLVSQASAR